MRAALLLLALAPLLWADSSALLRGSLDRFQKNLPGAAADAAPGSPVDRAAMQMSLTDASTPWRARYLAAEWLLRAHVFRSRMVPVPAIALERKDLEQAWKLVSIASAQSRRTVVGDTGKGFYRGSDPDSRMASTLALSKAVDQERVPVGLAEAMDTLALEIAVRLEDIQHMAQAVGPVVPRKNLRPREKTFALMAATHSGLWDAARAWARELADAPVFKALHEGALAHPEIFDYTAFADLDIEPGPSGHVLLESRRMQVKDYRLRLAAVEGPADAAARVHEAFPPGWRATGPVASPLFRMGAAAHWLAPGEVPLPLTGAGSEGRLQLRGYLLLPGGERRTETLDLKPDGIRPGRWVGTLLTEQTMGSGRILARFDAELELQ